MRDTLKYAFFLVALGFFLFQAARADMPSDRSPASSEQAQKRCANNCR